jgi:hypothetical protein
VLRGGPASLGTAPRTQHRERRLMGARQLMNFLHHCASARIDQRYPITGIDVAIFSQGRPQSDGTVASSTSLGTLAPRRSFLGSSIQWRGPP